MSAFATTRKKKDMEKQEQEISVLLSTAPPEAAERLAAFLVEGRLAACVNIVSGVTSVYRWAGNVERSAESLLVIKCPAGRVREVTAALLGAHPYEVPEVVALGVAGANDAYRRWVIESSGG